MTAGTRRYCDKSLKQNQEDVEITAEKETVGGRDIVTLRARWMT